MNHKESSDEKNCPHCGRPIPAAAILCPICGHAIVEMAAWRPPPTDKNGYSLATKKRRSHLILGILTPILAAAAMIGISFLANVYSSGAGAVLASTEFTLVPLAMGVLSAFCWKDENLTILEYFLYSLLTVGISVIAAGFFLREGVICLLIVSPLLLAFVFGGAMLGKWLFGFANNRLNLSLIPLVIIVLAADNLSPHHYKASVTDTVRIHASPAQIWPHLGEVSPIAEKPDYWLFRLGLPYPVQSTLSATRIGAERRCIFSHHLVFEERIVVWKPSKQLTFTVVAQPRDPEILGHARVERGQFLLQANGDGTTTLIGTSWYELYVYPSSYYDLWARDIARHVHLRVMNHIKSLCEKGQ